MKISSKLKLRLSLFIYLCILVFSSLKSGIFNVVVYAIASVITVSSTFLFIAFLSSRKPAEKNILNKSLLTNFYYKLAIYPLSYAHTCVTYIYHTRSLTHFEGILSTTVLSHYFIRILSIITLILYILTSASRTLIFISPARFISANANLWQCVSIPLIMTVLVVEIVFSDGVLSPEECKQDKFGFELYQLAFLIKDSNNTSMGVEDKVWSNFTEESYWYNETKRNITEDLIWPNPTMPEIPKVCHLFPSSQLLLTLLMLIEVTRLIAATLRKLKILKKNKTVIPSVSSEPLTEVIKKSASKRDYRSNSVSTLDIKPNVANPIRRGSLPLIPNHDKPKTPDNRDTVINMEIVENKPESQNLLLFIEVKNYILSLILRTYSLEIVLLALCLFFFQFPNNPELFKIFFHLDLYFVPIFWILIDKEVFQFSKKKVNGIYRSLMNALTS